MGWLTSRAQRGPARVCAVAAVVTLAVMPVGTHQLGPTTSFVPAVLAAVACFDVMSVWLLMGEYRDSGDRRMLIMAVAYLWSVLVMAGYAMAFPGVVSTHPPLAVAASVAPYLYLGWHTGFPALLGAAWLPWGPVSSTDRPTSRMRVLWTCVAAVVAGAAGYVASCVGFVNHLPVLIHGLDTSAMARLAAPIALPIVAAGLVVCGYGIRGRGGSAERWTFVAILVCLCDLCLTFASGSRFSAGWYAGRTMTVASAAVVLLAMLASFRRLKMRAETLAARDVLTGLPNRRAAYDALTALLERAVRMQTSLSIVMADLDHFKQINDRHGHAGGDAALRSAATAMQNALRATDMIARVGGEEFLILLPDADTDGARLTAERVRTALHEANAPLVGLIVTASFGVATWSESDASMDELLRRADEAMYTAKALGRDRVHSTPATDSAPSGVAASATAELAERWQEPTEEGTEGFRIAG